MIAAAIVSLWILILVIFGYWIDPVRRGIGNSYGSVETDMNDYPVHRFAQQLGLPVELPLQDTHYTDYSPEENAWEAEREAEANPDHGREDRLIQP